MRPIAHRDKPAMVFFTPFQWGLLMERGDNFCSVDVSK
jgi:hypothetical protein